MLGLAMTIMCAAITWTIAFQKLVDAATPDPFGVTSWKARAAIVGSVLIGCLAVARYLTYQPGRGLRRGLAYFLIALVILVTFFALVSFVRLGGNPADPAAVIDFTRRIAELYGPPAVVTFAAFLATELLLARL